MKELNENYSSGRYPIPNSWILRKEGCLFETCKSNSFGIVPDLRNKALYFLNVVYKWF